MLIQIIAPSRSFISGIYNKTYSKSEIPKEEQEINKYLKNSLSYKERVLWVSRSPKFVKSLDRNPNLDGLLAGEKINNKFYNESEEVFSYLTKTTVLG
ncbi:MAG: hypothetical protein HC932_06240 [Thermales bacterium]|nr:hypothetical protein [Thermales bacterium]